MKKCALFPSVFVLYWIYHFQSVAAFCGGDRSNIQATFPNGKTAHVTWDVSHTTCTPPVVGYRLHYDFLYNRNIVYKSDDVSGERTGRETITTFPSFQYSLYVNPLSSTGELKTTQPDILNFTAKKEVPGGSPSGIAATNVVDTELSIQWDKLSTFQRNGNILGYKIYYKAKSETTPHALNITGENTLTAVLTRLIPSSVYSIYISAIGEVGYGPWSSPLTVKTKQYISSSTMVGIRPYISTINPLQTTTKNVNSGTLNFPIPSKAISSTHIYTTSTTGSSRRSRASQTITSLTTTGRSYHSSSHKHDLTTVKDPEPDNKWDRILLIVGIAFGVLLLIAICVPLILHLCRCCGKDPVGNVTASTEEEDEKPIQKKNGFQSIKDETVSQRPISRSKRHTSTLARKMSYKLTPDDDVFGNDGSYYDYDIYGRKRGKNRELYNDRDSLSEGEISEYFSERDGIKTTRQSEFLWPGNPNKSRLVDYWNMQKGENGNTKYHIQYPPGFLHTDMDEASPYTDRNINKLSNSFKPGLIHESLQYHPQPYLDKPRGIENGFHFNEEMQPSVVRGNMKPYSSGQDNEPKESKTHYRHIHRNSIADTETLSDGYSSSYPGSVFHDLDARKKGKHNEKIKNLFNKKLKNTNNVYIHNFMAINGIFSKHTPQVDPINDMDTQSDDTEMPRSENSGIKDKSKGSNLRAIIYEQII